MTEWLKVHAWKACVGQPTEGSNPPSPPLKVCFQIENQTLAGLCRLTACESGLCCRATVTSELRQAREGATVGPTAVCVAALFLFGGVVSYLVLARKYRPQKFDEMVGQKSVVHTLQRAIELERIHHAFLFTGSRGVKNNHCALNGKKCLSCETGITANPCGECAACVGISDGTWADVREN